MTTAQIVLWVYIALLIAGGMMGLIKGKSKISLIASVVCAVPFILCQFGVIPFDKAKWILLALFVMFAWRFGKSKKFMPGGMLTLLTLATLAAMHFLK